MTWGPLKRAIKWAETRLTQSRVNVPYLYTFSRIPPPPLLQQYTPVFLQRTFYQANNSAVSFHIMIS